MSKIQQSNKRSIRGLHRPFNKPLKSLCWVCTYAKKWSKETSPDFYFDFYMNHLQDVCNHRQSKMIWTEGCIKAQEAQYILEKVVPFVDIKKYISKVLKRRDTSDDKLVYKTYKNISYYISLAKKFKLLNSDYSLTTDGLLLSESSRNFYTLSTQEKEFIFMFLLDIDKYLFLALVITKHDVVKGILPEDLELEFQRIQGINFEKLFVRSYYKNYINVMRSWIDQLEITSKRDGSIKKAWMNFFTQNEDVYETYMLQYDKYKEFIENRVKIEITRRKKYIQFRKIYDSLVKQGKEDLGFIDLYDIKNEMHMGYNRFNEFLNNFYTENKKNTIILFSNTVYSIDSRKRFSIGNKIVLKIKIIQKKSYEN